ncbi:MAG: hypothetical protein ACTSQE_11740, partial [Candidatus Heimdallarchaeaceae archaeon]
PCIDDKLKASLLFIDNNLTVRSQCLIEPEEEEDEENREKKEIIISGLVIPAPEKKGLPRVKITPTSDFGGFNLKGFVIKDKLRQSYYILNEESDGDKISVESPLKFIRIDANISHEIDKKIAIKWLKRTVQIMESIVVIDESVLSFLGTYLDHFITFLPREKELKELDLLFHAPISILRTTEESFNLFKENWKSIFPNLSVRKYRTYLLILKEFLDEGGKTLLDAYFQVGSEYTFAFFLSAISDLILNGILILEKLEFITYKEPNE